MGSEVMGQNKKIGCRCGPGDEPLCETSESGERLYSPADLLPQRSEIGSRVLEVFGFGPITNIVFRLRSTPGEINAVINGEELPSTELLLGIQKVVGASIDWILTGRGSKYISTTKVEKHEARKIGHYALPKRMHLRPRSNIRGRAARHGG